LFRVLAALLAHCYWQVERYRMELQSALSEAERFKSGEEQAQHRIQDLHLELEDAREHAAEYVRLSDSILSRLFCHPHRMMIPPSHLHASPHCMTSDLAVLHFSYSSLSHLS
jgi:hypothetical protein